MLNDALRKTARRLSTLEEDRATENGPIVLTSNLTLYVRTDGNDANSGQTNDAAGAFLTIQAAVDAAAYRYIAGPYTVTVQVQNGNWTGPFVLRAHSNPGSLTLRGDPTTPANVVLRGDNMSVVTCLGDWDVNGFTVQRQSSGDSTAIIGYTNRCLLELFNVNFGPVGANGRHMQAEESAQLLVRSNYTVTTGGLGFAYHIVANWAGSAVFTIGRAVTFVGAGPIAGGFAAAGYHGEVFCASMAFLGDAASLTGPRYIVDKLGLIDTVGGGANYLPGSSAGAFGNGGIYA